MSTAKNKSNKKHIVLSAMAVAAASIGPAAELQAAATTCVQSNIAMSIVQSPLNFASITVCAASGGTARINEVNGAFSTTGCTVGTGGTTQRARVKITGGQSGNGVSIRVTITNANSAIISAGTKTMAVTSVKMKQAATTYSFGGAQTRTIDVGGILNFGASQASGTYTGTFTVNAVCV